jgi:hypothetical protein
MLRILALLLVLCSAIAPVDGDVRMVQGSSDTHYSAYSAEVAENGTLIVSMSQNTFDWLPDPAPEGVIYQVLSWLP